MKKRGVKPKGKVDITWSANFAYAIGLLASDGCLQNDSRHIDLTSKDREQLENFLRALSIKVKITNKNSSLSKKYLRVQFGDVLFYKFLLNIGFTPAKSKTIGAIIIPPKYFFDFLRGSFDGDGTFYSYWDPRWRSSFMFYTVFASASKKHIDWVREEINKRAKLKGHLTKSVDGSIYQLKYAKAESLKLYAKLYYDQDVLCLSRKRLKIEKAIRINKA
ncbi:MAG TPA: LAGLIDADG family homing endonuclease [Candidatus Paceibacterota bacterium]